MQLKVSNIFKKCTLESSKGEKREIEGFKHGERESKEGRSIEERWCNICSSSTCLEKKILVRWYPQLDFRTQIYVW